jgi:hypothetical protein
VEELTPKRLYRPFEFGTVVHAMIEEYANKRDPFAILDEIATNHGKLFAEEIDALLEIVESARVIMSEYFAYWPERDIKYIPVGGKYSEHEFEIDIDDQLVMKGRIDAIVRTPSRLRWLTEHKSFNFLPSEDHRWRNLQSVVYIRAIEESGWVDRVDGVCWDYVRSHPPSKPQVLKRGGVSRKRITTLPSVVRAVLREHNQDERKYETLIEHAEQCRRDYFQRIFTPVNRTVVDNVFSGFVATGHEILDNHLHKRDQNIGRHCEWCQYEPICRAELTGGDVDWVKEKQYAAAPEKVVETNAGEKSSSRTTTRSAPDAKGKRHVALPVVGSVRTKRHG